MAVLLRELQLKLKTMEKTVKVKYLRITPKKMRTVIDQFKKMKTKEVMEILAVDAKKTSLILMKAIKSGMAMFEQKDGELYVKNVVANEGPVFKRWRAGSKGSAKPYQKRTTHLEIVLTNGK